LSERAFRFLRELYREVRPYIIEALRKEGIKEYPKLKLVDEIWVGLMKAAGATTYEGEILISAEEVDFMLESGFSEPYIKCVMTQLIFHELKHYKDFKHMTPEELEEYEMRFLEDLQYSMELESRADSYGWEWARRIAEEKGWKPEEKKFLEEML